MGFGILDEGLYIFIKKEGEVESPVTLTVRDNILLCSFPNFVCVCVYVHTYVYVCVCEHTHVSVECIQS